MRAKLPFCALVLSVFGTGAAFGQTTGGPPTLPHPPSPSLSQIEWEARRSARRPRDRPGRLSGAERKRLDAIRAPHSEDVQKYKDFLRLDNTGIIRLFPDADCVQKNLVRVDGDCANHVPGASGMSFRGKSANHDIRFSRGELIADGFFSVGMIVNLGAVELDSVQPDSKGLGYLVEYEPAMGLQEALRDFILIKAGESRPPFQYSNRAPAAVGDTFAARIVAFDADNIGVKRLGRDRKGVTDWETRAKFAALRYDNRGDVVAVFRIIRIDDDGSISLLWKRMSRKEAPSLKFDSNQVLKDFK